MNFYTVEFVFSDEATPRDLHTHGVKAISAEAAQEEVVIEALLRGDQVQTTGVMVSSWH